MYKRLADAHCHFDFNDSSNVEALANDIDLCVDACFAENWNQLEKFSGKIKKAYGIHPDLKISALDDISFIEKEIFSTRLPNLEKYLPLADAIGETGFDENINVPFILQKKIFQAQLELAAKYKLPVIIHCIGKWGDVLDVLKEWKHNFAEGRFLIHAARCSAEMVREFEKIGGYFSFAARELEMPSGMRCALAVSGNRLMLESDGESSLKKIADAVVKLSQIRDTSDVELAEMTRENFREFFAK